MKQVFWITNISNRNVSLTDLALTIKALSSVNLLDNKHYNYSLEQLQKSASSGSLSKKRDKLVVRQLAPTIIKKNIIFDRESMIPTRERSLYSIKEEHYEELAVSDEDFAKENADTAQIDASKQVIVKDNHVTQKN
jgi:hypothetical protein